ncbi:hypothetical protein N0V86_002038 [Didymella sp. IMI 355093]|nr:hypothetical protein N0V86_002038 [Didymella sp. IMI 355093]
MPTRYRPSIGPPKTDIHDPDDSDTDSLENNQSISGTSEEEEEEDDDDDDNSMLNEIISLRQDNASLRQRLDRKYETWYRFNISNAYDQWKKSFRNRPALGKRRFYWTCECGEEMFADLPLTNKRDCQRMLEFLSRPSDSKDQDQTTPSQLERGTVPLNYVTQNQSQSNSGKGKTPTSTISSDTTRIDSSGSQSAQAQSNGSYSRTKYLELCVNVGKYKTKLAEIQITAANRSGLTICTDGHLFHKIYTRYFELRQGSWRRLFYRPAGIKFVHFAVQHNEEVIFYSEDKYPTENVLSRKLYEYDLRPPIPPPMDSRTFLHYFYEHKAHSQLRSAKFVYRLPKKLGESLARSIGPEEFREGWGIHIMEGPNKVAICWALMIVLLASFGVSFGYDLITKTGDSGFAIGQWMVAALTVALSALYFSLEDEVNSNFD